MTFDFDTFINRPAMGIFGRKITFRPKRGEAFPITGDFHESYIDIDLKTADTDISSAKIVLFVRLCDFKTKPLAGDYVVVGDLEYQIINIEPHIPGSLKLILHEQ